MRVRTPICSVLFCLTALAQVLLPAHASALAPVIGADCELLSGGVYYSFSSGQFCNPNDGAGGNGGSSPQGEVIVVHDQRPGSIDCGSFSDFSVDRAQDCPRKPRPSCSADGCSVSRPRPVSPPKRTAQAPVMGRRDICRALDSDFRRVHREYKDVWDFMYTKGFSRDELKDLGDLGFRVSVLVLSNKLDSITLINRVTGKTVTVSGTALPAELAERFDAILAYVNFINSLRKLHHC